MCVRYEPVSFPQRREAHKIFSLRFWGFVGNYNIFIMIPGNENVQSVNTVVGETNDGYLNDIRGRHVHAEDVEKSLQAASSGPMAEGNVGAGTGTICMGFKGGIRASSCVLPTSKGGYTVGVLAQTNFGGILSIAGAPIGKSIRHLLYVGRNEL